MADVNVKATPVNSLANYVRKEIGDQNAEAIGNNIGPDGTRWFSGRLLAQETVPLTAVNEFTKQGAAAAGRPVEEFARAAGRSGAEQGIKTVYKFIMVLMSPESVLKAAPMMWKKVYDAGRLDIEIGNKAARISLHEFPADLAGCARITGWLEVVGEKSAEGMTITHDRCSAKGAPNCSWAFTWR